MILYLNYTIREAVGQGGFIKKSAAANCIIIHFLARILHNYTYIPLTVLTTSNDKKKEIRFSRISFSHALFFLSHPQFREQFVYESLTRFIAGATLFVTARDIELLVFDY